ncbi:hypothetical protein C8T65DRAFT_216548 [Cerioporus squamosus]|nr:hypothetical protein C8T65DRAFT_216548 [Cerioporus squamosus]
MGVMLPPHKVSASLPERAARGPLRRRTSDAGRCRDPGHTSKLPSHHLELQALPPGIGIGASSVPAMFVPEHSNVCVHVTAMSQLPGGADTEFTVSKHPQAFRRLRLDDLEGFSPTTRPRLQSEVFGLVMHAKSTRIQRPHDMRHANRVLPGSHRRTHPSTPRDPDLRLRVAGHSLAPAQDPAAPTLVHWVCERQWQLSTYIGVRLAHAVVKEFALQQHYWGEWDRDRDDSSPCVPTAAAVCGVRGVVRRTNMRIHQCILVQ